MAKSSPEKLAAALRANLKRRKEAMHRPPAAPPPESPAPAPQNPPKKPG